MIWAELPNGHPDPSAWMPRESPQKAAKEGHQSGRKKQPKGRYKTKFYKPPRPTPENTLLYIYIGVGGGEREGGV